MGSPKTIVHALHDQVARLTDRPALWSKRRGYYLPTSWREHGRTVRAAALGLVGLGLAEGDRVGLAATGSSLWVEAALATLSVGGVAVALPPREQSLQRGSIARARCRFLVVDADADLTWLEQVRADSPGIQVIAFRAEGALPAGVRHWDELVTRGLQAHDGPYWERVNALDPASPALLGCTAGAAKAVVLSHRNLSWTAEQLCRTVKLGDRDVLLSYAWLSEPTAQLLALPVAVTAGLQVYFASHGADPSTALAEVRPTVVHASPAAWERCRELAEGQLGSGTGRRAQLNAWAREQSTDRHRRVLARERVPQRIELQYQAAKRLVLNGVRAHLGLDRARLLLTSTAPAPRELLDFFASVDVVVRELYGQAETSGATSVNDWEATRFGLAGRALLGVKLRIADDGEILVRGDNVCLGYDADAPATAAAFQDGWLRSGDLGELDPEGYLRVIGRVPRSGRSKARRASRRGA